MIYIYLIYTKPKQTNISNNDNSITPPPNHLFEEYHPASIPTGHYQQFNKNPPKTLTIKLFNLIINKIKNNIKY